MNDSKTLSLTWTARLRSGAIDLLLIAAGGAAFFSLFNHALRRFAATREPSAAIWPAAGAAVAIAVMLWGLLRVIRRRDPWMLFLGAAIAFVSFAWLRPAGLPHWAMPVALLPILPSTLLAAAIVKMLRRTDELARRIIAEALALSFVSTFLAALVYAVAEAGDAPSLRARWVCVFLVLSFSVGIAVFSRRYE